MKRRVVFKPRAGLPGFLTTNLPSRWTQEIDSVELEAYLEKTARWNEFVYVDIYEFEGMIDSGSLGHISGAALVGTAVTYSTLKHLFESTTVESCVFADVSLTEEEFEDLRKKFPSCKFVTVPGELQRTASTP